MVNSLALDQQKALQHLATLEYFATLPSAVAFKNSRDGGMKILRFPELKQDKGVPWTMVHLRRLEEAGEFPRRVRIGKGTVGWLEDEIDEWIAERAAARNT